MTVVVFSVKPRARIALRRRRYREILARLDVRRGQKPASCIPATSGRPSRYSRKRWTRARGHYRRFACGPLWRGETSREATESARDGAREASLPSASLPSLHPRTTLPPRARRATGRASPRPAVCGAKARRRRPRSRRGTRMREPPTAPCTTMRNEVYEKHLINILH